MEIYTITCQETASSLMGRNVSLLCMLMDSRGKKKKKIDLQLGRGHFKQSYTQVLISLHRGIVETEGNHIHL